MEFAKLVTKISPGTKTVVLEPGQSMDV